MEVIDIDLGWKRIKRKSLFLDGKQLKAGVLWSAGKGKKGVDIAYYASCNEYGTYPSGSEWQRIPPRPFMATTADEKKMWKTPVERAVTNIIMDGAEVVTELNIVGEKMKTDIKKNIGTHRFKPLAASTVQRKGHDIQLIDSGALLDSIDFEVK